MTLAGWFLPLLWSTMRLYAGSLQVWSRPQYLIHGQSLAVRCDFSPFHSRPRVGCPRVPHGWILILALVECLFAVLALGLPDAARSVRGEALSPLRFMPLGWGASAALRLTEARPLTTLTPLASPPEVILTLHDSDKETRRLPSGGPSPRTLSPWSTARPKRAALPIPPIRGVFLAG